MRVGIIRPEGDGALVGCRRISEFSLPVERDAEIVAYDGIVRPGGEGAPVSRFRLVKPALIHQRVAGNPAGLTSAILLRRPAALSAVHWRMSPIVAHRARLMQFDAAHKPPTCEF